MAASPPAMLQHDGTGGFAGFQRAIALLDRCSLLSRTALRGEHSHRAPPSVVDLLPARSPAESWRDSRYTVSRFACCRKDGSPHDVESPLGPRGVRLAFGIGPGRLGALSEPRTSAAVAEQVAGLSEPAARELMNLIANAGALVASLRRRSRARGCGPDAGAVGVPRPLVPHPQPPRPAREPVRRHVSVQGTLR